MRTSKLDRFVRGGKAYLPSLIFVSRSGSILVFSNRKVLLFDYLQPVTNSRQGWKGLPGAQRSQGLALANSSNLI